MSAVKALSKPVGPLPLGVWLLVAGGGLAISFWQRRKDNEPELLTDVREVPVPVGAIASPDQAPLVITPIIRVPEAPAPIVNVRVAAPSVTVTGPAPVPATPTPPPASTAPPAAAAPVARSYTVVSGDSLWRIATRFYGSGSTYMRIYNANAGVIEAAAKAHGRASSTGPSGAGHWIYPGTQLVIP